jgi:hypothetical protein
MALATALLSIPVSLPLARRSQRRFAQGNQGALRLFSLQNDL